jgi:hypothetical protein
MSAGTQKPADAGDEVSDAVADYVGDLEWLARNSGRVPVLEQRDDETEAWKRGKGSVDSGEFAARPEPGVMVVRLPDGDPHATVLAEAEGDDTGPFAGACDCKAFQYRGVCAHLVARSVRSILRDGEVPEDVSLFGDLDGDGPATGELTDQPESSGAMSDVGGLDDVQEDGSDEEAGADPVDEDADPGGEPAETTVVDPEETGEDVLEARTAANDGPAEPAVAGDPFAQELAENVPERFVMDLGGQPYIRRAGFAAIARQADLRPSLEAVVAADETEWSHARYVATIRDADGDVVAQDVGTALAEHEDLANAEAHLDELAATRAIRRALEWATGAGATLQRDGGSP